MVANHLSRLESDKRIEDITEIKESFPDEQLLVMEAHFPWYADFVNYLACNVLPFGLSSQQKKKPLHDVKLYHGMTHCFSKDGQIKYREDVCLKRNNMKS